MHRFARIALLVLGAAGTSCVVPELPGCGAGEACARNFRCDDATRTCVSDSQEVTLDVAVEGPGRIFWVIDETRHHCDSRCQTETPINSTITLTPDAQFKFLGWAGACTGAGLGACVISMDQAKTAIARFEGEPGSITIRISQDWLNKVAVNGETPMCSGQDCTVRRPLGTLVTLSPRPQPGQVFLGWGEPCSGRGDCTLKVSSDQILVDAIFAHVTEPVEINVTVVGPGTIDYDKPSSLNLLPRSFTTLLPRGEEVHCLPRPDPGAHFVGWSGDCSGTEWCITNAVAPISVTATFESL